MSTDGPDISDSRQLDISPLELGFPPKFSGWRPTQADIILDAIDCPTRFLGQAVPTGGGKSPSYIAAATLSGDRTIILTSTKGLQDQILTDFSSVGMVDIRGKANYNCNLGAEMTCEDGADAKCSDYRSGRCPYSCAYGRAKSSNFVITNYTYWILINLFGEGLGRFNRMVCDEAHSAPDEVCGALTIELTNRDVLAVLRVGWPMAGISMLEWQQWAGEMLLRAESHRDALKLEVSHLGPGNAPKELVRRLRTWRSLCRKLLGIMMAKGEWIASSYEDGYRFDPLWAADYAEEVLFIHVPKVNLVSATLTEKTIRLLGIEDNYQFIEYPSTFPPENSPLIWVPTVRMSHSSDEYDLSKMLMTLDDLIQARMDRKIIVHTVSYDRRDLVLKNSRFADIMITHDRRDVGKQVALFKRSIPPAVLVSPSVTTGYDFPYCVAPETKILSADLLWRVAADFKIGDPVAAFDEYAPPERRSRQWDLGVVTAAGTIVRPCYKLTFGDGSSTICSAEHQWLTVSSGSAHWVTTERLYAGTDNQTSLARVLDVWNARDDRDAGFLAAAFDAEGHLCYTMNSYRSNGSMPNVTLAFAQNDNSLREEVRSKLMDSGYHPSGPYPKREGGDCSSVQILQRPEIIRFLGEIRPTRLMEKFNFGLMGSLRSRPLRLVHKEYLGEREVIALSTTTRTFIADGLASHNSECECQIIIKIPFPVRKGNPIMEARSKQDPDYPRYITAQTLTQMCGRGNRAPDDRCENIVIDNMIRFLMKYNGEYTGFFPLWFKRLYKVQRGDLLPAPPLKLKRRTNSNA